MITSGSLTWLFCPADRPDRYARATASAPVVIFDLEDAVEPDRKAAAREALVDASHGLDPTRTVVRINPLGTHEADADLAALRDTPLRSLMVPKAERADQLDQLSERWKTIALCETAAGVLHAAELVSHEACVAITWGGQDLALSVGADDPRDATGQFRAFARHARMQVLYAAAAAGKPAIDTVWILLDDAVGLDAEAREAAANGFAAKMAIHPSQAASIRAAFRPQPERVEQARAILQASEAAGAGASRADGLMLDRPVIEQARAVLAREAAAAEER